MIHDMDVLPPASFYEQLVEEMDFDPNVWDKWFEEYLKFEAVAAPPARYGGKVYVPVVEGNVVHQGELEQASHPRWDTPTSATPMVLDRRRTAKAVTASN